MPPGGLRADQHVILDLLDVAVTAEDVDRMMEETLGELQRLLKLDSATFFLVEQDRFIRPCDVNIDTRLRQDYMDYYYAISLFRPNQLRVKRADRNVFQIEDLIDRRTFQKTEFYSGHFQYLNIHYITGVYLRYAGDIIGCLCLNRANPRRPFHPSEVRLAEALSDRLAKVLHLHLAREREQQRLQVLQVSSEHLDCGILTLNRRFEPLYQNGRARGLLARLEQETGAGEPGPSIQERIRQMLSGDGIAGDTRHLPVTLSEKEQYLIQASKLAEAGESLHTPVYLVEIREQGSSWNLDVETLRRRYDLSTREVEIVGLIAHGLSNKEIADKLCISPWTVITHVKNIFSKMQVHNRTSAVQKALEY